METRVYYGEYSLKHWIDLMLAGDIELPAYQRHFVWQERDIKRLIKSLKEKQFVQPVTIALYHVNKSKKNLILDGQQRLTSVLLTYLGYIPDRKKFLNGNIQERIMSNDDDSALDDGDNELINNPILWKFNELLLNDKNNKDDIIDRIKNDDRYIKLTDREFTDLSNDFFENTFIGFSYIIPESINKDEIQKVFSRLFRNINYFGMKLDFMDSRKSLYFQNSEMLNYFEGKTKNGQDVLCGIKIMENLQPYKIDFVRYLSILSQFVANDNNEKKVLVGYSSYSSRESYYSDYVSYVLGQGLDQQESRPEKFLGFNFYERFPGNSWQQKFEKLKKTLDKIKPHIELNEHGSFNTWIDADYWLFGLIYIILFKGQELIVDLTLRDGENQITLHEEIKNRIIEKKGEDKEYYAKNPNRLNNLRERLKESCEIYSKYVHQ
ncbi:MAG: DUF262 domain-containing protein [Muribaculaceae bacterium]|nr:DUF262 domain-containing protein [Muribaculaceae bacterium]